jgi:1-acyl-sn-glycerol-3-phosphate acyltransferase
VQAGDRIPATTAGRDDTADTLLAVIRDLIAELHPQAAQPSRIALDSALERELGIDSLGRVELLSRLEGAFRISFPEQVFRLAETPRDLLRAIRRATPATATPAVRRPVEVEAATQGLPHEAATLVDVLEWHAASHPQRTHIRFHADGDTGDALTYGELRAQAGAVAGGLQQEGLQPGDTVALMLPTSRDYFFSYYGVLLAGGIPVPVYPPVRMSQLEEHLLRQRDILMNCQASLLIAMPEAQRVAQLLKARVGTLRRVVTAAELLARRESPAPAALQSGDIAFLQYTSGSTGSPKGVILTHANLLANIRADGAAIQAGPEDIFVSWLPLYHDMGLIGAWLGSLYHAVPLVILSPLAFLSRPLRWLQAIQRHQGTLSAAPNFAYELCLKKITDTEIAGLDLSTWRIAFNGAEAVGAQTVRRFCERFRTCGFRPETMYPVYGLAECSLGLCFPPLRRAPRTDVLLREPFQRTGRALPAVTTDESHLQFVSCGHPLPGHQVRILGPGGRELPERREGRLEFRGPSATSGYYRNPQATRALFHDEWLDSGDLAYIADGEVFITGRAKDVIIRAGRQLYPDELEAAIGELPGIRKGCVVIFGCTDPAQGTERLVVLAELRDGGAGPAEPLRREINTLTTKLTGGPPSEIILAPAHTVPKTSSGKLRRTTTRTLYEQGRLLRRSHAVWWQVTRFALAGMLPGIRHLQRRLAADLYAGYSWLVFGLFAAGTWFLVGVLPGRRRRWRFVQRAARTLLRVTGLPLQVRGLQHLPPEGRPCVLVANHASYMDSIALAAALPQPVSFVAKAELTGKFAVRWFLERLDTRFVERFDRQQSIRDARELAAALPAGRSLLFFPEGTLTRMPGLQPFLMGAFLTAAQAGVPVIPVALRGTRSILRDDSWFPQRGVIRIDVGAPLRAGQRDGVVPENRWQAALELRNGARAYLLRHCGEPDLEGVYPPDSTSQMGSIQGKEGSGLSNRG